MRRHDDTDQALTPAGYRFPLGRPAAELPPEATETGEVPVPFGVRFFAPTGRSCDAVPPVFRYSHELQVAVTDDGNDRPIITLPEAAEKTTTGHTDGGRPRGEEFNIDYLHDSTA